MLPIQSPSFYSRENIKEWIGESLIFFMAGKICDVVFRRSIPLFAHLKLPFYYLAGGIFTTSLVLKLCKEYNIGQTTIPKLKDLVTKFSNIYNYKSRFIHITPLIIIVLNSLSKELTKAFSFLWGCYFVIYARQIEFLTSQKTALDNQKKAKND